MMKRPTVTGVCGHTEKSDPSSLLVAVGNCAATSESRLAILQNAERIFIRAKIQLLVTWDPLNKVGEFVAGYLY